MTVDEYIEKLKARPRGRETTPETFALVEEALEAHPNSAKLWCFRGALIQLGPGPEKSGYKREDALASYRKAIEVEPDCHEGWEQLGYYYDAFLCDQRSAKEFWAKAEKLRIANDDTLRSKLDRFNSRLAFANANGPVYEGEEADINRIVFLDPPNGNIVGHLLSMRKRFANFLASPNGEVRYEAEDGRTIYVNRGITEFQAAARIFNAFNWSSYDPDDCECEYFQELTTRFAAAIQQIEPLGDPNESLWSATVQNTEWGLWTLF